MTIRDNILCAVERHRSALGLSRAAYSRAATGNEHFLRDLRDLTRAPGLRAIEKAEEFMRRDPAGLDLSETIFADAAFADRSGVADA